VTEWRDADGGDTYQLLGCLRLDALERQVCEFKKVTH
jgi:hypothetical protein